MVQVRIPEAPQLVETPRLPQQCDSCSARAMVHCLLPFGELYFCLHHYNKHATALKGKGAVSTLLGSTQVGRSE